MKEKNKNKNIVSTINKGAAYCVLKALCFLIVTIFLFSGAIYPIPVQAFTYSNSIGHYSFSLPNDWEEIPKDVIDDYVDELTKIAGTTGQSLNYTTAFQLSDTEYYFEYPYIVTQDHSVNTPSYSEVAKLFSSDKVEQLMSKNLKDYSEIIHSADMGKPFIDKERNILFINMQADIVDVGPVDALMALFLGKQGITVLNFYTVKNEYSRWLPVFNSIIDSFQYDIGYVYNPAEAAQYDSPSIFEGVIERGVGTALGWGLILLIIGLFLGLKNWLWKFWKKNKEE